MKPIRSLASGNYNDITLNFIAGIPDMETGPQDTLGLSKLGQAEKDRKLKKK